MVQLKRMKRGKEEILTRDTSDLFDFWASISILFTKMLQRLRKKHGGTT